MNWFKKALFDQPPDPEITKWELMGLIRAHLGSTPRFSTKELLYNVCQDVVPVQYSFFANTVDEMIERGFLEKAGEYIKWNIDAPSFPGNKPL